VGFFLLSASAPAITTITAMTMAMTTERFMTLLPLM
jgi:hypothetical protein